MKLLEEMHFSQIIITQNISFRLIIYYSLLLNSTPLALNFIQLNFKKYKKKKNEMKLKYEKKHRSK